MRSIGKVGQPPRDGRQIKLFLVLVQFGTEGHYRSGSRMLESTLGDNDRAEDSPKVRWVPARIEGCFDLVDSSIRRCRARFRNGQLPVSKRNQYLFSISLNAVHGLPAARRLPGIAAREPSGVPLDSIRNATVEPASCRRSSSAREVRPSL